MKLQSVFIEQLSGKQTQEWDPGSRGGLTPAATEERDMAWRPAAPTASNSLEKQLSCSLCLGQFKDPVTTSCGHSFCQDCLSRSLRVQNAMCPHCKNHLCRIPEVSIVLKNVVEEVKIRKEEEEEEKRQKDERDKEEEPRRFRRRPGQVACDVCSKMAATKSCLVCLTSFCEDHLQNHLGNRRLKGHRLVDPVQDLDQRACLTHGRPLELYRRTQQECICTLCLEEGEDGVVSTEHEWCSKKAKLNQSIEELQEKILERQMKMDDTEASFKSCKDRLDTEVRDIENVFSAARAAVEAAQDRALRPVLQLSQRLAQEAAELRDQLQTEVDELEDKISELKNISPFEDHILFLQRYRSLFEPADIKDWATVELDTSVCLGSMRKITTTMLRQIQEEMDKLTAIELRRFPKFAEDVKLDPNTSHKCLVLSEDRREVFTGEANQEVEDNPDRFDILGGVLGSKGLGSGRAYWEVQVGGKSGWDLGVVSASADRKGKIMLTPESGYWAMVHYEGEKYAALRAPPVGLQLKHRPQRVGVFVDYEEGLVTFYNVTDQEHIYSFEAAGFDDELFPYFSLHLKDDRNTEPPVISPITRPA